MYKQKSIILSLLIVLMPGLAYAQDAIASLSRIGQLLGLATPILAGVGILVFIWGLVRFIFNAADEEKRKEGKKMMGWSIIAIFVMVSIWGIIGFLEATIYGPGVRPAGSLPAPCVEGVIGTDCKGSPSKKSKDNNNNNNNNNTIDDSVVI